MDTKHYLEYYDDSAPAEMVGEIKDNGFSPRSYAESYLTFMLVDNQDVFMNCLKQQQVGFVHDVFCRCYELYGADIFFTQRNFAVVNGVSTLVKGYRPLHRSTSKPLCLTNRNVRVGVIMLK